MVERPPAGGKRERGKEGTGQKKGRAETEHRHRQAQPSRRKPAGAKTGKCKTRLLRAKGKTSPPNDTRQRQDAHSFPDYTRNDGPTDCDFRPKRTSALPLLSLPRLERKREGEGHNHKLSFFPHANITDSATPLPLYRVRQSTTPTIQSGAHSQANQTLPVTRNDSIRHTIHSTRKIDVGESRRGSRVETAFLSAVNLCSLLSTQLDSNCLPLDLLDFLSSTYTYARTYPWSSRRHFHVDPVSSRVNRSQHSTSHDHNKSTTSPSSTWPPSSAA